MLKLFACGYVKCLLNSLIKSRGLPDFALAARLVTLNCMLSESYISVIANIEAILRNFTIMSILLLKCFQPHPKVKTQNLRGF